jgi:hypothetical protein
MKFYGRFELGPFTGQGLTVANSLDVLYYHN